MLSRDEILREAQEIFFNAMLYGWTAGIRENIIVSDKPGYKEIPPYEREGFRVVGSYYVSSSGKSVEITIIWYFNNPVWFMSCSGFCRKKNIPFLKRALMVAYEKNEFNGGRGPDSYEYKDSSGEWLYTNCVSRKHNCFPKSTFLDFSGIEYLHNSIHVSGESDDWHEYLGMALI